MSTTQTKSIYLGADGKLSIRDVSEIYIPKGSQSLVRVHYSGVNLCDLNFAHLGLNSFVTGFEFSGIVEQPGPNSSFKSGQAVCGLPPISMPQPSSSGSHQDLAIAEDSLLYAVPPGLDLKDAGGLAMASHTAADGLFNGLGFSFPAGKLKGTDPTGHPILIWGGASSVGVAAIQMAKSAGFWPIFTTASTKNHATLQGLGATQCFDYKNPAVAENIRAAAKAEGVNLTTGFDAVGRGGAAQGEDAKTGTPFLTKSALSDNVGLGELKLVSTTMVPEIPQFRTCAAYRPGGDRDALGFPQDPEAPDRIRSVVEYFLRKPETVLKLPVVKVVKGGSAGISEIERVARGDASLEKIVIEHPI